MIGANGFKGPIDVAKLAGHADPAVTLGHYTQAVRGGAEAVAILDAAYSAV